MKLLSNTKVHSKGHDTAVDFISNKRSSKSSERNRTSQLTNSDEGQQGDRHADPPQVLFMDTQDIPTRSNHHASNYYQVATPRSPHELSLVGDEDDDGTDADVHNGDHRESEETERLKYETAKGEIMDQLNLHILINHKELDELQSEIRRVEAQMKVLETLHEDKKLLEKVEKHQEHEFNKKKQYFLNKQELGTCQNPLDYSFESSLQQPPSSASSSFYYHTRSKSGGNIAGAQMPRLRPANQEVLGMRVAGSKFIPSNTQERSSPGLEVDPFKPQLMNQHHRRNYSSTCLTSNSGVVGKNDKGEAIFKRPDGVLVIITCSKCSRSGFTSAQGIVNHARLKHSKTYSSQPLAVLNNQQLLPEDQQNPSVIERFKELDLNPAKEYLPTTIGLNTVHTSNSSERKLSFREVSPNTAIPADNSEHHTTGKKSTKHLEKMYAKNDFRDIVDYVNEAKQDLDAIMKIDSGTEDDEEEETCSGKTANTTTTVTENLVHISGQPSSSPPASVETTEKQSVRKRKCSTDRDMRERLRPAEKKARPDAVAIVEIPEKDKRSSHYNLRAKSKLRGHSRYD